MAEAASTGKSGKVVIKNIGLLLSGDIDKPILDADTIVVNDGLIVAVGKLKDCDVEHAATVIDVHQTCVCPGLIESTVPFAPECDKFTTIVPCEYALYFWPREGCGPAAGVASRRIAATTAATG